MTAMDGLFGSWLAGFFDGEGCFKITPALPAFHITAEISLRLDDLAILNEIQTRTGIGRIYARPAHGTRRPQGRWYVQSKSDCQSLCQIFDKYPLRAKKARDYAIWREAVKLHGSIKHGSHNTNWEPIVALAAELKRIREFDVAGELSEIEPSPQLHLLASDAIAEL